MAGLADRKIAAEDYAAYGAHSLDDSPTTDGSTAAQIKDALDGIQTEVVIPAVNGIIDDLVKNTSTSGSELIGSKAVSGVTGSTVYAQIASLKGLIGAATIGALVEDTITDAYLKQDGNNIIPNFTAHLINYLLHIADGGTTGGTASAYTATVTSMVTTGKQFFIVLAHATNTAGATLSVNSGTARQVVALDGTNIEAGHMTVGGTYLLMYNNLSTPVYVLLNPAVTDDHIHAQASVTGLVAALAAKAASSHTHAQADIINLVTALAAKQAIVSGVSDTELGYLASVTSDIQTQINAKLTTSGLLSAILGIDGAASGIDADVLDTFHASDFKRVNRGGVTDFNTALTDGEYLVSYAAANGPYGGNLFGKLRTFVSDGTTHDNASNYIWQDLIDTNGAQYTRYKITSGAWSTWIQQPSGIIYNASEPAYVAGAIWLKPV